MTTPADPYEAIAPEYYDAVRHPTSANFRFASARLLRDVAGRLVTKSSDIVEVGCGDSVLMEVLKESQLFPRRVVLTDASPTMLAYSRHWLGEGVELVVSEAESLMFSDGTFDVAVSILGDPYNTPAFWTEIARTTKPGGSVFFTTPSHEWSSAFRGSIPRALFDAAQGPDLAVASFVYSEDDQRTLIERAGLIVTKVLHAPRSWLPPNRISPKLQVLRFPNDPVVTAYVAAKPAVI